MHRLLWRRRAAPASVAWDCLRAAVFGPLLGQSHNRGGRPSLLAASWLLCAALLHLSYECNLRAGLVRADYERPVDSLKVSYGEVHLSV